jgi:hypothetical protein
MTDSPVSIKWRADCGSPPIWPPILEESLRRDAEKALVPGLAGKLVGLLLGLPGLIILPAPLPKVFPHDAPF